MVVKILTLKSSMYFFLFYLSIVIIMFTSSFQTWIALLKNIGSINWPTLIVSIVAILALVIFRVVNSCLLSPRVRLPMKIYKRRERKWVTRKCSWPLPIPAALIVIIVAAVIAYYGRFQERFDVAPVGTIPDG